MKVIMETEIDLTAASVLSLLQTKLHDHQKECGFKYGDCVRLNDLGRIAASKGQTNLDRDLEDHGADLIMIVAGMYTEERILVGALTKNKTLRFDLVYTKHIEVVDSIPDDKAQNNDIA